MILSPGRNAFSDNLVAIQCPRNDPTKMKESKEEVNKTLKHVWHKVKHGKRKDSPRTKEDAFVLCKNDALNEEVDTNANSNDGNKSSDSRWNEIELISSTEEVTQIKTKKKFKKRVSHVNFFLFLKDKEAKGKN